MGTNSGDWDVKDVFLKKKRFCVCLTTNGPTSFLLPLNLTLPIRYFNSNKSFKLSWLGFMITFLTWEREKWFVCLINHCFLESILTCVTINTKVIICPFWFMLMLVTHLLFYITCTKYIWSCLSTDVSAFTFEFCLLVNAEACIFLFWKLHL